MTHMDTVRDIYAAFGRGDVPAIVERAAEATRWDFSVESDGVPWHQPITGRAHLPAFFQAFGGSVAVERFEPHSFVASADSVVVGVSIAYTVKSTGRRVAMEQVHWWRFDPHGKVAALRHYEDTAQVARATAA
jgi:ketosteroid isomerase-like protein